jgi:hypothetical protein
VTINLVNLSSFLLPFLLLFSACENSQSPKFNAELTGGKWELIHQGGTVHDICPGETIQFLDLWRVTLQCPRQEPVQRTYRIYPDNVLNYVETATSYIITHLDSENLQLQGTGSASGRLLTYKRTYE